MTNRPPRDLVLCCALVALVGCGAPAESASPTATTPPSTTAPASSSTAPPNAGPTDDACVENRNKGPVRRSGLPLKFGLGLDMDCGRTTRQARDPGADVSVMLPGRLVVTSSDPRAGVAWVDGLGREDFDRCAALADTDYLREVDGLDRQAGDRELCVRTGEGNLAILHPKSPVVEGGPGLDLTYAIRYEP